MICRTISLTIEGDSIVEKEFFLMVYRKQYGNAPTQKGYH